MTLEEYNAYLYGLIDKVQSGRRVEERVIRKEINKPGPALVKKVYKRKRK